MENRYYGNSKYVLELSPDKIDENGYINDPEYNKYNNPNHYGLVHVYAHWCGHCKVMIPMIEELGELSNGHTDFNVVGINATLKENTFIKNNVDGYPTLFFVDNNGKLHKYNDNGDRSYDNIAKNLIKFIKKTNI